MRLKVAAAELARLRTLNSQGTISQDLENVTPEVLVQNDVLQNLRSNAQRTIEGFSQPDKFDTQVDLAKALAGVGSTEVFMSLPAAQRDQFLSQAGQQLSARALRTVVNTGERSGLTTGNRTELNRQFQGLTSTIQELEELSGGDFEELVGRVARGREFLSSMASQAAAVFGAEGPDQEFLDRRQRLKSRIGSVVASRLRSLSGATVTNQERQRLTNILGDIDEHSDAQFQAAMEESIELFRREQARLAETLGEGGVALQSQPRSSRLEDQSNEQLQQRLRELRGE